MKEAARPSRTISGAKRPEKLTFKERQQLFSEQSSLSQDKTECDE